MRARSYVVDRTPSGRWHRSLDSVPPARPSRWNRGLVLLALVVGAPALGCSSSAPESKFAEQAPPLKAKRLADGSIDDQSRCDWRGRQDREVVETAGPGAIIPNARRVFAVLGQGPDRQRVLVCREIDTNLDGIKDVVRKYNDKGEALFEEADTNFDGRIDTWLTFSKGRIAESKLDTDYDGNPDEWDFYVGGKLSRARRDTNHDGKPDRWEIYGTEGKLERIGVDLDGDERVDRWDYDTDIRRARDEKERKEEEAAAEKAAKERAQGEYETTDDSDDGTEKKDDKKKSSTTPSDQKPPTDSKTAPPANP
jgi:hypothetical protein